MHFEPSVLFAENEDRKQTKTTFDFIWKNKKMTPALNLELDDSDESSCNSDLVLGRRRSSRITRKRKPTGGSHIKRLKKKIRDDKRRECVGETTETGGNRRCFTTQEDHTMEDTTNENKSDDDDSCNITSNRENYISPLYKRRLMNVVSGNRSEKKIKGKAPSCVKAVVNCDVLRGLSDKVVCAWMEQQKAITRVVRGSINSSYLQYVKFDSPEIAKHIVQKCLLNHTIVATPGMSENQFVKACCDLIVPAVFNKVRHNIQTKLRKAYMGT